MKIYRRAISFSSSSFHAVCMLACSITNNCHARSYTLKTKMLEALHAGMNNRILLQNIFIFSSVIVLGFLHPSMHLPYKS